MLIFQQTKRKDEGVKREEEWMVTISGKQQLSHRSQQMSASIS
jgi:hypothetical protein